MSDYLELGPTPHGEQCLATGIDDTNHCRMETQVYRNQLVRLITKKFGQERADAVRLKVKGFSHDFGTYHEVVGYLDDDDTAEIVYWLDENCPENWDAESIQELRDKKIPAKILQ